MEYKYFTTSDYNKFTSNTLDAKITQNNVLIKIKTLARKEETKALATKAELKVKQDKIVKLQTYDLSLVIGQSYFVNDGPQLYIVFQPIQKTITTFFDLPYTKSQNGNLIPANICWSSRRLEDVFKTCLEDVFNTSSA